MRWVIDRHNTRKVDGSKGVGYRCAGFADRRNVIVRAVDAVLDVELQVRAEGQQVLPRQCDPVPHGAADAPKRARRRGRHRSCVRYPVVGNCGYVGRNSASIPYPAAKFLGLTRTKTNFVGLIPPALIGIGRVFSVYAGSEGELLKWHGTWPYAESTANASLMCLMRSSSPIVPPLIFLVIPT